jgi:hypothetical protein
MLPDRNVHRVGWARLPRLTARLIRKLATVRMSTSFQPVGGAKEREFPKSVMSVRLVAKSV